MSDLSTFKHGLFAVCFAVFAIVGVVKAAQGEIDMAFLYAALCMWVGVATIESLGSRR